MTLRTYQKDGTVVQLTSDNYQPFDSFVVLAVWEGTLITFWINGKRFGPSSIAGFDHLGPLLLFGLDVEDELSADTVLWVPIENMLGLYFQKGNIGHGAIFVLQHYGNERSQMERLRT